MAVALTGILFFLERVWFPFLLCSLHGYRRRMKREPPPPSLHFIWGGSFFRLRVNQYGGGGSGGSMAGCWRARALSPTYFWDREWSEEREREKYPDPFSRFCLAKNKEEGGKKLKEKQEKSNKQIGAKVYDQDDAGIFLHHGSVEEFFLFPFGFFLFMRLKMRIRERRWEGVSIPSYVNSIGLQRATDANRRRHDLLQVSGVPRKSKRNDGSDSSTSRSIFGVSAHPRPSLTAQLCTGLRWRLVLFVATNQRNSLVQFSCSIFIFKNFPWLTPIFVARVLLTLQSSTRRNQPVALKVSVMPKLFGRVSYISLLARSIRYKNLAGPVHVAPNIKNLVSKQNVKGRDQSERVR